MAKKPAPLTSQLLVRKGEATPSSINPDDRAVPAEDENAVYNELEAAPTEAIAQQEAPQSSPTDAPAPIDPRPQTPEPEFIIATDEDAEERGSKRRLVGVLALVAVSVIAATAVAILGGGDEGQSVAPTRELASAQTSTDPIGAAGNIAAVLTPSSPQSVGAPTSPEEIDLRPALNAGTAPSTGSVGEAVTSAAEAETTSPATELPQPAPAAPARAPARIEPIIETATTPESTIAAPIVAAVNPAQAAPAAVAPASSTSLAQAGQYLIQLLSVRSEADARRAWAQVQTRHAEIIGNAALDLETADLGARGTYIRVRFGAFDERSAANTACKALKAKGQDCLVKRAE
ncbi:MAG: SPOR domain-containing protein [Parvibaculum sp.]